MRISDWSSDVCSSDLPAGAYGGPQCVVFVECEFTHRPRGGIPAPSLVAVHANPGDQSQFSVAAFKCIFNKYAGHTQPRQVVTCVGAHIGRIRKSYRFVQLLITVAGPVPEEVAGQPAPFGRPGKLAGRTEEGR